MLKIMEVVIIVEIVVLEIQHCIKVIMGITITALIIAASDRIVYQDLRLVIIREE